MESLGLSQKDAKFSSEWRRWIKGATANRLTQFHMENWPFLCSYDYD